MLGMEPTCSGVQDFNLSWFSDGFVLKPRLYMTLNGKPYKCKHTHANT